MMARRPETDSSVARSQSRWSTDPEKLVGTVAPYALDPDNAERLWTVSETFLR
jgi:hypothetical protein